MVTKIDAKYFQTFDKSRGSMTMVQGQNAAPVTLWNELLSYSFFRSLSDYCSAVFSLEHFPYFSDYLVTMG